MLQDKTCMMFMTLFTLVKLCSAVTPEENSVADQQPIRGLPYMVSVHNTIAGENEEKVCTGFFVGPNWAMTAAHCFDGGKVQKTWIKFGVHDYSINTTTIAAAKKIVIHPDYYNKSHINDIALIRVRMNSKHIKLVSYVLANEYGIKWHESLSKVYRCITIGYDPNNYKDTKLQVKKLFVRNDPNACGCFATNFELLCSKALPNDSVCLNNYGGPLVCNGALVGLANRILHCDKKEKNTCGPESYYRFTNICPYFQWISDYVDIFPDECFGYRHGLLSSFTYHASPATHIILVFFLIISIL